MHQMLFAGQGGQLALVDLVLASILHATVLSPAIMISARHSLHVAHCHSSIRLLAGLCRSRDMTSERLFEEPSWFCIAHWQQRAMQGFCMAGIRSRAADCADN